MDQPKPAQYYSDNTIDLREPSLRHSRLIRAASKIGLVGVATSLTYTSYDMLDGGFGTLDTATSKVTASAFMLANTAIVLRSASVAVWNLVYDTAEQSRLARSDRYHETQRMRRATQRPHSQWGEPYSDSE
jgi:hypothetical protein